MGGLQSGLVKIETSSIPLEGELLLPEKAKGLVIFAHGSGSSRQSPRNQSVAKYLRKERFGTLLFDLLTRKEGTIYENRFNIDPLANRLLEATRWLRNQSETDNLPFGYFGASTGAAAALQAASEQGKIKAIVSRGGRPDLAEAYLERVRSPTLLVVGGNDVEVLKLNEMALQLISCEKRLEIIPEATHLFEEPGALEEVARLASLWFSKYF